MKPQGKISSPPVPLASDRPREITDQPLHDEVEARAKKLWDDYGHPAGREGEIWIEAEKQILWEACHGHGIKQ